MVVIDFWDFFGTYMHDGVVSEELTSVDFFEAIFVEIQAEFLADFRFDTSHVRSGE